MQKIVLFNGPPRAGKDTAGQICKDVLGDLVEMVKFTTPVKNETHRRYGLKCAPEAFEALKDKPLREFRGKSPREAYLAVSADLKRQHGPHCVAHLLADEVRTKETDIIINTDVGYDFEAQALQSIVGAENTVLIRLHRNGKSYDGDCRDWVYLDDSKSYDISNNSTSEDLRAALKPILDDLLVRELEPAFS